MDIGDASSAAADAAVGGVDSASTAGSGDYSNPGFGIDEGIPGLGPSETGPMHSPGLSYATLDVLNDIGLGKMDIPGFSQTVEQALASQNAHSFLNQAVPTLVSMFGPPGAGIAFSALDALKSLETGRATPGQAALSFGIGALGVPGPVVSALQGNLGPAASGLAQSGLAGLVGKALDVPAPIAGLALNLSNIGPSIGQAVAGAVPNAPSTGILEGISGFIDQALGGLSLGSMAPGTPPTPGSMTAPDSGYSADVFPVMAAIEEAAQPQQQTPQPTFQPRVVAGRYGPLVDYQFGA